MYNFVTVNAGTDINLCAGDTAYLGANATGGANNFLWYPSSLVNDSMSANTFALPNNNSMFIASQQPSGCVDTVQVNVNSTAIPVISQVGFNLGSSIANSYQWYVDGVAILGATLQEHFPSQIGNYTVVTTDANGCSAQSAPYNVTVVGLNALQNNATSVYPNPAKDVLFINSSTKFKQYTIYNSLGKIVIQNSYTPSIDVKLLTQGVYLLELLADNKIERKMWVKE